MTADEEWRLPRREAFRRDARLRARLLVGQRAEEVGDQMALRSRRVREREVADLQPGEQETERRPLDPAAERPAAEPPRVDTQAPAREAPGTRLARAEPS